ncbi:MAG TPA: YdeI/OmpD-associated family protein [Vicinamibacterales bacterium]|nr:YdeI/OmpD-associated family protein [Vicinamibacterales bacterium]
MTPKFFASARAFRAWLERHHDRETELLVGFHKKASPRRRGAKARAGMTYGEALDEALAFGWIDGVRRNIDADRWSIRFSPRKPRSIWSNVNVRHVTRLIEAGRMAPAGLRAFDAREERRSGIYLYERTPAALEPALEKRFAARRAAKAFFDAQPPGYRRIVTGWVMQAKKQETREKRLARLIEKSARRERVDLMKPNA